MNNNLYVIHFKVEGRSEVGHEGGDNEDPGNGDDTRMEEFQHNLVPEPKPSEDRG
jgi:hypothetical protein